MQPSFIGGTSRSRRNIPYYRRQLPDLPECGNVCITNQSQVDEQRPGGCGFTNTTCHCTSAAYMQPMYNCFATACNHADEIGSYEFCDAICASVGAQIVSGLTTQDPRSATSTSTTTRTTSSSSTPSTTSNAPSTSNSSTSSSNPSSTSSASPSPGLSNIPTPTYSTPTSLESSISTSTHLANETASPAPNTGAIVGGLVAGIAVLALLIFGLWLRRRRNRLKESPSTIQLTDKSPNIGLTTPYEGPISETPLPFRSGSKQPLHIPASASNQPYAIPESGIGASETDDEQPRRPTSTVITAETELPPPAYQPSPHAHQLTRGRGAGTTSTDSPNPFASYAESLNDGAEERIYNDDISRFCSANRDLISPTLENKLRAAHWLPSDDPNEMPAERWRTAYGVEFFELKRIQEAYSRSSDGGSRVTSKGS